MDAPGQFEVLPFRRPGLPAIVGVDSVYESMLKLARKETTRQALAADVRDFARFMGMPGQGGQACELFLGRGVGEASEWALGYYSYLIGRNPPFAAATINRRLATLRRLLKVARRRHLIAWSIDLDGVPSEPYRDTRGPGLEGWHRVLTLLEHDPDTAKTRRDLGIIWLLGLGRALRRGELVGLDLADADLSADRPAVFVLGKGRRQKQWFTIGPKTATAVGRWIEARGRKPGPLFVPLDPGAGETERLRGNGVWRIVRKIGRRAMLERRLHPHGFRHLAITAGLDSGRSTRDMTEFSRHKNERTVQLYDDRRKDIGGQIARELEDL